MVSTGFGLCTQSYPTLSIGVVTPLAFLRGTTRCFFSFLKRVLLCGLRSYPIIECALELAPGHFPTQVPTCLLSHEEFWSFRPYRYVHYVSTTLALLGLYLLALTPTYVAVGPEIAFCWSPQQVR